MEIRPASNCGARVRRRGDRLLDEHGTMNVAQALAGVLLKPSCVLFRF